MITLQKRDKTKNIRLYPRKGKASGIGERREFHYPLSNDLRNYRFSVADTGGEFTVQNEELCYFVKHFYFFQKV